MGERAPTVVFYVSGHGFGHASRVIEVINALGRLRPDASIHVRTPAARWLFDATVTAPFTFSEARLDVGVVQVDALVPDLAATLSHAAEFYAQADDVIAREAEAIQSAAATVVVSDSPPLVFPAAARAGVPSIAFGNFTWGWIYRDYEVALGLDTALSSRLMDWQSLATATWRLPMHGGFDEMTPSLRDLPLVARRSKRSADEVRQAFGWNDGRTVVLSSFGGIGVPGLPLAEAARADDLLIVTGTEPHQQGRSEFAGVVASDGPVLRFDERRLYEAGWRYEDLVAAADVVVTKPGYGIVAECTANGTALLYAPRGRFAEYEVLVEWMPRWLRCRSIDRRALLAGEWGPAVRQLVAQAAPPERPRVDGADVAADWLAEWLPRTC